MLGPDDAKLYTDDHVALHLLSLAKGAAEGSHNADATTVAAQSTMDATTAAAGAPDTDVPMAEASESKDETNAPGSDTNAETKAAAGESSKDNPDKQTEQAQSSAEKDQVLTNGVAGHDASTDTANHNGETTEQGLGEESGAPGQSDATAGSEVANQSFVHPMFIPPGGARPDRDLGVPENEAEDLRRMLNAFIQKQEEVARGAQRLHDGLNRAERRRKDVLHWSKAEAHCGPNRDMSDGEDWYDKEEWGLTEDLKKGQDDEEEDTTTTAKKTRARR